MWLRRAFFGWLIPAAFVLPLWLLIGWGVFNAGAWAFLWVLFLAIPGVFVWQLVLTLLIRARGTVRAHRAVTWPDVAGLTVWHLLVIALGFFDPNWWALTLVAAIVVGLGLFWFELSQLWSQAKPSGFLLRTTSGVGYIPPTTTRSDPEPEDVIIITEKPGTTRG
ncbi:MFS transporter permease [Microbacterium sp. NPDC055910]|uniref:MFS transporter permease n=1 Tax=Microbacterium sp. NPDC055910 TaxID=3345659 RepID=UPI0035E38745